MRRHEARWVVVLGEFCPGMTIVMYEEDKTYSKFVVWTRELY